MPHSHTLAVTILLTLALVAPVGAQSAGNPDHDHPDNIDWSPDWAPTTWTIDHGTGCTWTFAGVSWTLSPTGAVVFNIDDGVDSVFQVVDDQTTPVEWLNIDLGTTNIMQLTATAGSDLQIGNATGDVDILSDGFQLTLTAATAGALSWDEASGNQILAVNTDSDLITLGDAAWDLTADIDDLDLNVDSGADIDFSGAASTITSTSQNLTIETATSGILDLNSAGNFTLDAVGTLSLSGAGASDLTVDTGNLTIETTTSGNLNLIPIGNIVGDPVDIDWDPTGTYDMEADSTFSIDGTGASNVSATSGSLTISTLTSGNLILDSAGGTIETNATTITADAGLAIGTTGATALALDTGGAAAINIGAANANAVNITPAVDINGAVTLDGSNTVAAGEDEYPAITMTIADDTGDDTPAVGAISIDDDRSGAEANAADEASLLIDAAGTYSAWFKDGNILLSEEADLVIEETGGTDLATIAVGVLTSSYTFTIPDTASDANFVMSQGNQSVACQLSISEPLNLANDLNWDANSAHEVVTIDSTDVATTTGLVTITDLRAGANNDTLAKASFRVASSGSYGANFADGDVAFSEEADIAIEETGGSDLVTIAAAAQVNAQSLTIPDVGFVAPGSTAGGYVVLSPVQQPGGASIVPGLHYYDDFVGDTLRDEWSAVSGAGTAGRLANAAYGQVYLVTAGAGADWAGLDWDDDQDASIVPDNGDVVLEVYMNISALTTVDVEFGLGDDALDQANPGPTQYVCARFDVSTDATNWYFGGDTAALATTGDAAATGWHVYRICVAASDGDATFYIDGVLAMSVATATAGSNGMVPYFHIEEEAAAARTLLIDYVHLWQER